jgi:hypothetical protein
VLVEQRRQCRAAARAWRRRFAPPRRAAIPLGEPNAAAARADRARRRRLQQPQPGAEFVAVDHGAPRRRPALRAA